MGISVKRVCVEDSDIFCWPGSAADGAGGRGPTSGGRKKGAKSDGRRPLRKSSRRFRKIRFRGQAEVRQLRSDLQPVRHEHGAHGLLSDRRHVSGIGDPF